MTMQNNNKKNKRSENIHIDNLVDIYFLKPRINNH